MSLDPDTLTTAADTTPSPPLPPLFETDYSLQVW